ncbi:MAG: hypothetical protein N2560_09185 [Ignavibacteria bacterium]|nr:hypothetical protein [Ignavibacteria bacterium]
MKRIFIGVFFVSIALLFAENNSNEGLNVIKSKNGFVFVFNDSSESFKIEIKGKKFVDVEPEELIFSIDGQIVQFTIVPVKEFFKNDLTLDTLLQHFEFEKKYISNITNSDLQNLKPKLLKSKTGRKVCFWELNRNTSYLDTSSENVTKQIFASTNTYKYVILISSPLTKRNDFKKSKNRLINSLLDLQRTQGMFNLDLIRESLKRD